MVAVDHPDATMDMFYRSIGVKNDMFPSQIGSTPAGGQDSDRTGERSDYDPAAMNIV